MDSHNHYKESLGFGSSLNVSQRNSESTHRSNRKTLSDYEVSNEYPLGRGTFGTVYKAKDKHDGKWYALKQISKANLKKSKGKLILEEIRIHKYLNHPFIAKLKNCFEDSFSVYLVLELIDNSKT